jgi:hypothetical protein
MWAGSCNEDGYGQFGLRGGVFKAHRVAYAIANASLPPNLHVLHNCDTPGCCYPGHLFIGTQDDNVKDMMRKGRGKWASGASSPYRLHSSSYPKGNDHWTRKHPGAVAKGEDQPAAKLTEDDVKAIRALYAGGGITQQELADQYGVTKTNIRWIIKRRTWTHI